VFGNLELPFSEHGKPFFSYETTNFFVKTDSVKALGLAGFDVVSLANNHILECGPDSLKLTQDVLLQENISSFGAGENLAAARKPLIKEVNNIKVGFLGYSTPDKQSALPDRAGASPLIPENISVDIEALKPQVDFLIVSLHFGMTYIQYPSQEGIEIAHNVIDMGANLILGHHPHVLQGIEEYKEGLIAYSLGEFIFDPTQGLRYSKLAREERRRCFIFSCEFTKDKILDYSYFPTHSSDEYQPYLLQGEEAEKMKEQVRQLSQNIGNPDFWEFAGPKVVKNEMELLFLHLKKLNLTAVFSMLKRIRKRHFLLFFGFVKAKVRGK